MDQNFNACSGEFRRSPGLIWTPGPLGLAIRGGIWGAQGWPFEGGILCLQPNFSELAKFAVQRTSENRNEISIRNGACHRTQTPIESFELGGLGFEETCAV